MKLILIGCPGAGKGTQAKKLSKHFDIAHISTGDLLREQIQLKTELGKKVTNIMNSGHLVPNEIVTQLLSQRIEREDCKNGYILDGYPRNLSQAEKLSSITGEIDKVVLFEVDDDAIIERMSGRRSCPKCGHMYHIKYNPPVTFDICDECGSKLIQRKDDAEETVKNRLKVYHETTSPIVSFYDEKGLLLKVSGVGAIDEISSYLIKTLEEA
ncbi:MAG: adenylate kinase [Clostridiales bacterium]|nr:adenylate kinase [Clostridiales bacterium]